MTTNTLTFCNRKKVQRFGLISFRHQIKLKHPLFFSRKYPVQRIRILSGFPRYDVRLVFSIYWQSLSLYFCPCALNISLPWHIHRRRKESNLTWKQTNTKHTPITHLTWYGQMKIFPQIIDFDWLRFSTSIHFFHIDLIISREWNAYGICFVAYAYWVREREKKNLAIFSDRFDSIPMSIAVVSIFFCYFFSLLLHFVNFIFCLKFIQKGWPTKLNLNI